MRSGVWLALSIVGLAALVGIVWLGVSSQDRTLVPAATIACPSLAPPGFVLSPSSDARSLVVTAAPDGLVWNEIGLRWSHRAPESYPWQPGAWQVSRTQNASELGVSGAVRVGDHVPSQAVSPPMVEAFRAGFLIGGSGRLAVETRVDGANVTLVARDATNASVALPHASVVLGSYRVATSDLLRPLATSVQAPRDATLAPGGTLDLASWTAPGPGAYVLGIGTMDDAFTVCSVVPVTIGTP